MDDDWEEKETHPSFGMIGFSRVSLSGTSKRLFGSHLEGHHSAITMRVYHGERRHTLSSDWFGTDGMLPIVEVVMSPAQFAEAITTMNVGDGVPCTIDRTERDGKIDPVPDTHETEQKKVHDGFRKDVEEMVAGLQSRRKEIATALKKSPKKVQKLVLGHVEKIFQEVEANMPFVLTQFEEAAEKVVAEAKAEVEAFTLNAVTKAGLASLRGTEEVLPALPEKPTKPEKQVKGTGLTPSEWALLREGAVIGCIKRLRDRIPLSLYAAKTLIDIEQREHPELLEKPPEK